ncbi:YfkD family protein [Caldalkalibacillus mannanilyticus]|uniref:YfkD family protein n=1 Tax=Caldalkalibacillus mannanilyticus TaxID=1418 RepID=UPI0005583791|nr:YfkD family protein [Caldalkalibacillus mannanilyticus]
MRRSHLLMVFIFFLLFGLITMHSTAVVAEEQGIKAPDSLRDISRQNTYPNPDEDPEYVQPSPSTAELFQTTDYKIDNPNLIRLLNETSMQGSKFAFGFRANIYLGNWPLSYESKETSVNWEYKLANSNKLDNRGGNQTGEISFEQNEEFTAAGGLTTDVLAESDVKKLMISSAKQKTGLNISFKSTVGKGTKHETMMKIPPRKVGYLKAYMPAVNERGIVTYGEVYLQMKGSQKKLVVKNVTQKGVGAWIPVQDRLTFKYLLTDQPK